MRITKQTIRHMHDGYRSLNRAQLAILGVPWPPSKGWRKRLIGTEITERDYERVLALNGTGPAQKPARPKQPKSKRPKRLKCVECGHPKPRCEFRKANRNPPRCNRCVATLPPRPSRGPQPANSRRRVEAMEMQLSAGLDDAIAKD